MNDAWSTMDDLQGQTVIARLQLVIPKVRLIRRFVIPKVRYSEGSLIQKWNKVR